MEPKALFILRFGGKNKIYISTLPFERMQWKQNPDYDV
jgi:hypothetical protein